MLHVTQNDKFPLRLFSLLFTSIALLILAGAWYVGNERIASEQELIRSGEIGTVVLGVRRLDDELHVPYQQLHTLAKESAIQQAIDGGDGKSLQGMAAQFSSLIAYNGYYDKVRWVDQTGMERVRVNNVAGKPVTVAAEKLQNLSAAYFFRDTQRLKPGQYYISPLDLNIENGQVEAPHKPVLRLATPVQDRNGKPRGILIINIAAQHLLDSFTESLVGARDHAMLLNSSGAWLVSPNLDDAFNPVRTLARINPPAWQAISAIPSGQVETGSGLWTWSTAYPLKVDDDRGISEIPQWLVVSQLPASQLEMISKGAWSAVGINTVILLLLFGFLSAWLARALTGRARALVDATRAHAEAAAANRLAEVHQRFRLVVEANSTGLLVVDSAGRIVLTNPALERMFGYTREELVGQAMEILLPESEHARHVGLRGEYLNSPQPRPMGAGRDLHGRRRDGSILPVEISLSSFTENGERFVDAVVVDISQRQRMERLRQYSETRLQVLMQTNPNGLVVVDDLGRIQMTNPALERMFGYEPGELLDKPVEALLPEASRAQHNLAREHYMQAPSIRSMGAGLDLRGQRKDGSVFPVAVSLASFVEDDRTYAQATIIDLSEIP